MELVARTTGHEIMQGPERGHYDRERVCYNVGMPKQTERGQILFKYVVLPPANDVLSLRQRASIRTPGRV
jgi:hypothetical protein